MIPLGPWLPDLPPFENPGATEAKNVIPQATSYGPWKRLALTAAVLDARARGAASGADPAGNAVTFAGDASKLYRLSAGAFGSVSKAGGYATADAERWQFVQYDQLMLATNYSDPIQAWTLGTSTEFADLTSDGTATKNAPKCRYMAVVKGFLVCGNNNDAFDGVKPNRLQWSPLGNPEGDWTPSITTQADFQDLATGGEIRGIVGGEFGTVFTERSITRMTYAGTPLIFQFDELEQGRGCAAAGSIATTGRLTFFYDENGFYVFDGQSSTPIGADQVDEWFAADADAAYFDRMWAAVNPVEKVYALAYAGAGNASGTPNRILIYNWSVRRWSYVETDVEMLCRVRSVASTLEELDAISSSIDLLTTSLDSRLFAGGAGLFGGFSTSHAMGTFTGTNMDAVVETGEFSPHSPRLSYVNGVRPVTDADCTVQLGTRTKHSDPVTWGAPSTPEEGTGVAPFRSEARYHRARLNLTGDNWKYAQGIEVDAIEAGDR